MSGAPKKQQLPVRGADRKPARVRPYSLTGGRTRFGHVLLAPVYGTGTGHGIGRPDRALLERVLSGLRRL